MDTRAITIWKKTSAKRKFTSAKKDSEKGKERGSKAKPVANARAIGADTASGGAIEQGSERLREQPYSHSRVRAGDKRWID
ncbi:hypothetical protein NMY22_g17839 [Coprinellus aureogranulatus]|nr:hypothetical protein NMY22_g17839 [Coprinellus aureogranulatus]